MSINSVRKSLPSPALLLVAATALACLAVNLWFTRTETHPPTFDDAWYLETSCRFFYALREEGPLSFYKAYSTAFRFKAPLISVLALPAFFIAGISHDTALWAIIASALLLILYLFLLGKILFNETVGMLAAVIATTLPLLAGLTHRFMAEVPLAAVVTATLYHLAASDGLRRRGHVRALGVCAGLGMLLKVLYPIFVIGALLDVLWRRYRETPGTFFKDIEPPLKTIAIWGGLISLTWYAHNLVYTIGYIFRASFGDIAAHYGGTEPSKLVAALQYWHALIEGGFSYYYVLLAIACTATLLYRRRSAGEGPAQIWCAHPAATLLLSSIFLPLLLGTVGVNKAIRFMAPIQPAFALLLAAALDELTNGRRWRTHLLILFFIPALAGYCLQTFGLQLLPQLQLGPISFLKPNSTYSGAPQRGWQWRHQELVDWIGRETAGVPTVVAIGTESGILNANNLSYFSARRNSPVHFISYGYEEGRIERTVVRLLDKGVDHLLLIDGLPPGFLAPNIARVEGQLRGLINDQRLPFSAGPTFLLTDKVTATLYHRSGPIRIFPPLIPLGHEDPS